MKAIHDPTGALAEGLVAIREQYRLPGDFPPEVLAAAEEAIHRPLDGHSDRTSVDFATLDPASSCDLDQAFFVERSGGDLILRYAIADVGWFVRDGEALDTEAWKLGTTIYLPGNKVPLYPKRLSEGAASLLPDVERPAIVFSVRIDSAGDSSLDQVERALIRSRAKLGYATVKTEDLPPAFSELSRRIATAERVRGAARIDPPQQEVDALSSGSYALGFRPMSPIEQDNAALSLAANLAIADALMAHHTGLFRVMPEPGKRAVKRLKHAAKAVGIEWPAGMDVAELERSLDPNDPKQATFMLAARRAGERASYAPFHEGEIPWHSAVSAPYVHATAPLRRLGDRYVCLAALAIASGKPVDPMISEAFQKLPAVMQKADSKSSQVESAVVELAESVVMSDRIGGMFDARVIEIDMRGAKVQLCDEAVLTRLPRDGLKEGDAIRLKLIEAIPSRRLSRFERV